MSTLTKWLALLFSLVLPVYVLAGTPDCDGVDKWASNMAFVHLKNAGITDNDKIRWEQRKVHRLSSEQIGKDLYRQVHLVTFAEKSGNAIEVITVNDASHEECSMSAVDVYVISKHLGGK